VPQRPAATAKDATAKGAKELSPLGKGPALKGPAQRAKRGYSSDNDEEARKTARVKDGVQAGGEAEHKGNGTMATPCKAATGAVPIDSTAHAQAAAALPAAPPPCDTDLLQAVAERLLTAVNDGSLDSRRASKTVMELTSLRLAREPGGRARLVVRARAIKILLDDDDYEGLAEVLGD
jgi:hypothetical protein